jgi:hypothetical protein
MDQRRGQVFVWQWGPLWMPVAQVRVAVAVPHSVLQAVATGILSPLQNGFSE